MKRSSKTGFLFFLLLQMSLLSKVWPQSTTIATTAPDTTAQTTNNNTLSSTVNPTTVSCPAFDCTTDCSFQLTNVTANPCPSNSGFCEVMKRDTSYSVGCSESCHMSCGNTTTGNCSWICCNTTNCINDTVLALNNLVSTTVATTSATNATTSTTNATTSTTNATTTMAMVPVTQVNNVSCPAFDCTTDCPVQFMNACLPNSSFCEVMKQGSTSYSVNCSAPCGTSCGNTATGNCSWKCCNTTNCINGTMLVLNNLVSTTVATTFTTNATTSTTTATTTKTTVPVTLAPNGKKCHNIKCDGAMCYKSNPTIITCTVGQDYCMLKRTTTGTTESWLGGCSDDCRKMTACSASVTPCYLECCNATSSASCLKLTGDVNMPSSATRGPQSPALLMASLLLLWIARVFT